MTAKRWTPPDPPERNRHTRQQILDQCRNGRTLVLELPEQTVEITAEKQEIGYQFFAENRRTGRQTDIDGMTVWKRLLNHDHHIK